MFYREHFGDSRVPSVENQNQVFPMVYRHYCGLPKITWHTDGTKVPFMFTVLAGQIGLDFLHDGVQVAGAIEQVSVRVEGQGDRTVPHDDLQLLRHHALLDEQTGSGMT